MYLCKNFAACSKADSKEEIELPAGTETKCPECGAELHPMDTIRPGTPAKGKPAIIAGVAALVIAMAGGGTWFFMSEGDIEPTLATASPNAVVAVPPDEAELQKQKKLVDEQITGGKPAAVTSDAQRRVIAQEFVKAAMPLMQAGDWAAADAQLERAREANPDEPLVYINQAIVQLKQSRSKEALKLLETAFEKGFRDFQVLEKEPDLKKLTAGSSYRELIARYQAK